MTPPDHGTMSTEGVEHLLAERMTGGCQPMGIVVSIFHFCAIPHINEKVLSVACPINPYTGIGGNLVTPSHLGTMPSKGVGHLLAL